MLAPLILDCCDAGIQIQPPEEGEELRDRIAGTEEEVRGAGTVAAPKSRGARSGYGAGDVALAVPVGCGGDDGGGREAGVEEEVVDVPPGRAVAEAGEAQVPLDPGKPSAPPRRPDVDMPAGGKLPEAEGADPDRAAGALEDEGVDSLIHSSGALPGRPLYASRRPW